MEGRTTIFERGIRDSFSLRYLSDEQLDVPNVAVAPSLVQRTVVLHIVVDKHGTPAEVSFVLALTSSRRPRFRMLKNGSLIAGIWPSRASSERLLLKLDTLGRDSVSKSARPNYRIVLVARISHRQHHPELRLPAHHAVVGFRGFCQRVLLDHRAHTGNLS